MNILLHISSRLLKWFRFKLENRYEFCIFVGVVWLGKLRNLVVLIRWMCRVILRIFLQSRENQRPSNIQQVEHFHKVTSLVCVRDKATTLPLTTHTFPLSLSFLKVIYFALYCYRYDLSWYLFHMIIKFHFLLLVKQILYIISHI